MILKPLKTQKSIILLMILISCIQVPPSKTYINKKVNYDLKNVVNWLRANRISLNVDKTDIILFRSKQKSISKAMNFRISGQRIKTTHQTKYLGLLLDENLTFTSYLNALKVKLNRANRILSKIRYFVSNNVLKAVYYALFDSHMRYVLF